MYQAIVRLMTGALDRMSQKETSVANVSDVRRAAEPGSTLRFPLLFHHVTRSPGKSCPVLSSNVQTTW